MSVLGKSLGNWLTVPLERKHKYKCALKLCLFACWEHHETFNTRPPAVGQYPTFKAVAHTGVVCALQSLLVSSGCQHQCHCVKATARVRAQEETDPGAMICLVISSLITHTHCLGDDRGHPYANLGRHCLWLRPFVSRFVFFGNMNSRYLLGCLAFYHKIVK